MFSRAVLVDAGDAASRGFFEKYGFVASMTDPRHLIMRTKDIRKSLPAEEG